MISAFGQRFARSGKLPAEFHRYLIDAQSQRTRADYDPRPELSQQDAEKLLQQARSFITAAYDYLR